MLSSDRAPRFIEVRKGAKGWYLAYNPPSDAKAAKVVEYRSFMGQPKAVAYAHAEAENQKYDVWLAEGKPKPRLESKVKPAKQANIGTVAALFAGYKEHRFYLELAPNSQRLYSWAMQTVGRINIQPKWCVENASVNKIDAHVADFLYETILNRDENGEPTKRSRANICMSVMRKIWKFGVRYGFAKINPFEKMGLEGATPSMTVWAPEQFRKFITQAEADGWHSVSLAYLIAYVTSQRISDVLAAKRSQIKDGHWYVTQQKTKKTMAIPLPTEILTQLGEDGEYLLVCESTRKPWTYSHFSAVAKSIREKAGLPADLHTRHLRNTAATEALANGVSVDQITNLTGNTAAVLREHYLAAQSKTAKEIIEKRGFTFEEK